ncbi:MAG TPA: R3H domain-containing nucleic acid-binding protein, partial [Candidatus Limnocylindrales bacterium]|nr:R3H domain-containing nucleic acid-binding protein [Candidatus Limnocylindrales bacterium]
WRESAMRAIEQLRPDGGDDGGDGEASDLDEGLTTDDGIENGRERTDLLDDAAAFARALDEDETGEVIQLAGRTETPLETLRVLGFGVSRKRLEQAIRELQLPVLVVREVDEADAIITLRNHYKQKAPALREGEERGLPIFVLKSNTILQIEACLTSMFALDVDPSDLALREVEEAIGLVRQGARPVELSPQNAYVRRLQHQAAERANLVSRSRGREPYRRVRVYPDRVRAWR